MIYKELMYEGGKPPVFLSFASSGFRKTDEVIGIWWGDSDIHAPVKCLCVEGLGVDVLEPAEKYHHITKTVYESLPWAPKSAVLETLYHLSNDCNIFSYNLEYVGNMLDSLCGGNLREDIVVHDLLAMLSWQRTGQIITGDIPTLSEIDKEVKKSYFFRAPTVPDIRRQMQIEIDPSRPTPEQNVDLLRRITLSFSSEEVRTDQI